MTSILDKFRQQEAPKGGGTSILDRFRSQGEVPGSSPQNPINEEHPELPPGFRTILKNYARSNPKVIIHNLNKIGFDAVPIDSNLQGVKYAISKKGENKWRRLDPNKYIWEPGGVKELWEDVKDIKTDLLSGIPISYGAVKGGAAGIALGGPAAPVTGPAGAIVGAGFAGAAYEEGLREYGERVHGLEYPLSMKEEREEVAWGAAAGAGGETLRLVGKGIKAGGKAITRKAVGKTAAKEITEGAAAGVGGIPAGKAPDIPEAAFSGLKPVIIDAWPDEIKTAVRNAGEPVAMIVPELVGGGVKLPNPVRPMRSEFARSITLDITRPHPDHPFQLSWYRRTPDPITGEYGFDTRTFIARDSPIIPQELKDMLTQSGHEAALRQSGRRDLLRLFSLTDYDPKLSAKENMKAFKDIPADTVYSIQYGRKMWRVVEEGAEKVGTPEKVVLNAETRMAHEAAMRRQEMKEAAMEGFEEIMAQRGMPPPSAAGTKQGGVIGALNRAAFAGSVGGKYGAARSLLGSATRGIAKKYGYPGVIVGGGLGALIGGPSLQNAAIGGIVGGLTGYGIKKVARLLMKTPQALGQMAQLAPGPVRGLIERTMMAQKNGSMAYRSAVYILMHNPIFKQWVASQGITEEED